MDFQALDAAESAEGTRRMEEQPAGVAAGTRRMEEQPAGVAAGRGTEEQPASGVAGTRAVEEQPASDVAGTRREENSAGAAADVRGQASNQWSWNNHQHGWEDQQWRTWASQPWWGGTQWHRAQPEGQPWAREQQEPRSQLPQPTPARETADPPPWPGWTHYREWKRAVRRWDATTDILASRRGARVMRTFDWALQERLAHVPEETLQSERYLEALLTVLDLHAGEHQEDDLKRALHGALMAWKRDRAETLTQYTMRRDMQCREIERHGVVLPETVKGYLLLQGAALTAQSQANLRTLTSGQLLGSEVSRALRTMDTTNTVLEPAAASKTLLLDEEEDAESWTSSLEEAVYAEVSQLDLDEAEAEQVWAAVEQAREQAKPKRRTWMDNKKFKTAIRRDRSGVLGMLRSAGAAGAQGSTGQATTSNPPIDRDRRGQNPQRKRMTITELKLVSRCANCGQRGHWKAECTNPYKPKERSTNLVQPQQPQQPRQESTAFVYAADEQRQGSGLVMWSSWAEEKGKAWLHGVLSSTSTKRQRDSQAPSMSLLTLPTACAIVDSAAGQDLMGLPTYKRLCQHWEQMGVQPIRLDRTPRAASGVGGKATPLFQSLIPIVFAGAQPGFLEVTIVDADLPHLLSVGFLTHMKAVIDLERNVLSLGRENIEIQMERSPGGHCYVDIAAWTGEPPILMPEGAAKHYGVPQDALLMKPVAKEERQRNTAFCALQAFHRAYGPWLRTRRASENHVASAAVHNRVEQQVDIRGNVTRSRTQGSLSNSKMAKDHHTHPAASIYILLAASAAGVHWQADHDWARGDCASEQLCSPATEKGCEPTRQLGDVHRLQDAPILHLQGQDGERDQEDRRGATDSCASIRQGSRTEQRVQQLTRSSGATGSATRADASPASSAPAPAARDDDESPSRTHGRDASDSSAVTATATRSTTAADSHQSGTEVTAGSQYSEPAVGQRQQHGSGMGEGGNELSLMLGACTPAPGEGGMLGACTPAPGEGGNELNPTCEVYAATKIRITSLGASSSHLVARLHQSLKERGVPKHYTRTNVSHLGPPRSLMLGACTTRTCGVTRSTMSWLDELQWIRQLAQCRGRQDDEYTSVMINQTSEQGLPGHRDKNNQDGSLNWVLPLGEFQGGETWIEDYPDEMTEKSIPLPESLRPPSWDTARRGTVYNHAQQWLRFNPQRHHAVLPVHAGTRFSITLFLPAGLSRLDQTAWSVLNEHFHCTALSQKHQTMARWRQHGQVLLAAEPELANSLWQENWLDGELSDAALPRSTSRALRRSLQHMCDKRVGLHVTADNVLSRGCTSILRDRLGATSVGHTGTHLLLLGEGDYMVETLREREAIAHHTWWIGDMEQAKRLGVSSRLHLMSSCHDDGKETCLFGIHTHYTPEIFQPASTQESWCRDIAKALLVAAYTFDCVDSECLTDWLEEDIEVFPVTADDAEETVPEEEAEANAEASPLDEQDTPAPMVEEGLNTAEKELIHKVHVNAGHPPRELLHRALAAAGCKASVLRYVQRDYECPACLSGARQQLRRKVTFPRTFQFGKLLGVDVFFVSLHTPDTDGRMQTVKHPVLNMVDHGTNLQHCQVLSQ
eukprot:6492679-Amphidinium_carterae.1